MNPKEFADQIELYQIELRSSLQRHGATPSTDTGPTPDEVSTIWNHHVNAFGQLASSGGIHATLVASRGVKQAHRDLDTPLARSLHRMLAPGISLSAHGIGPRLERGLQAAWFVETDSFKQIVVEDLGKVLRDPTADYATTGGSFVDFMPDPPRFSGTSDPYRVWLAQALEAIQQTDQQRSYRALKTFLDLWMYIFSHWAPRGSTLVNQLLRDRCVRDSFMIYTVDARDCSNARPEPTYRDFRGIMGVDCIFSPLLTQRNVPHFLNDMQRVARRLLAATTATGLARILETPHLWKTSVHEHDQDHSNEIVRHMGTRILRGLHDPTSEKRVWAGVMHCLTQLQLSAALNSRELDGLWSTRNAAWEALPRRKQWHAMLEWIGLLIRFLVSHSGFGRYFYFLVPPPVTGTTIRMCFTIGVNEPLDPVAVGALTGLVEFIRHSFTKESKTEQIADVNYRHHHTWMPSVIGEAAVLDLDQRVPGWQDDPVLGGLPFYLRFVEGLAEQATHEGTSLAFEVVVADGVCRYQKLETITSLNSPEATDWREERHVVEENQTRSTMTRGESLEVNFPLISRVLGNFAFAQNPGVVFLGNRGGRLLALARVLPAEGDSEELTRNDDAVVQGAVDTSRSKTRNHTGCYVVRLRRTGEIDVLYRGGLLLRRAGGRYTVVAGKAHGAAYRKSLSDWLDGFLKEANGMDEHARQEVIDSRVLADVCWSIAEVPGEGACFALGPYSPDPRASGEPRIASSAYDLSETSVELTQVLPHAEAKPLVWRGTSGVLRDLAVQDGVTMIDSGSGLVFGRRFSRSRSQAQTLRRAWKKLADEHAEALRWGARHLSAFDLSRTKGAMLAVITISSDGEIHVFRNGQVIAELTYTGVSEA